MTTCKQTRINKVDSVAAGPQEVPYVCGQPLAAKVLIGEAVHLMCEQCAEDAVRDFGAQRLAEPTAARLRELEALMRKAAIEFATRLELSEWLEQCAVQMDFLARDMEAGRL